MQLTDAIKRVAVIFIIFIVIGILASVAISIATQWPILEGLLLGMCFVLVVFMADVLLS